MSTITTRSGKGSPLTNTEVDNNFTNLNTDKIEADSTNTLTNKTIDAMSNVVGANHIHYKVKATANLAKGVVVKITGYNSGEDAYEVAAISSASDIAVGIVDSALSNGDFGLITNTGLFEGLDTSAFSVGDILYPNTSGGFTATRPTTGQYQAAAFVLRAHAVNGAVMTEFTEPHDSNLAAFVDAVTLPTSDGTSGQALITDGSGNISFGDVDALPSQTGNSGKYLTTDGTDASWGTVDLSSKQDVLAEGAFTDGDKTKLDGIESGATADQSASEIKTAYESNANTNAYTDAEKTKLSGIESGADVTDTTNVTAAGALMDSEVTNLAQVKAFDSSDYATSAQGTLADSAVQPGDNVSDLTNDSGFITGNQTITLSGDVSGSGTTSISVTVADDSHNHVISNVDGLQTALDGKQPLATVLTNTTASFTTALNSKLSGIESGATADQTPSEILTAIKTVDGAASGLDADLLDGQQGSYYASTSYVDSAVAGVVDSAPATLDTLNELAAALGDDPNFATTISTSIGEKLAKASNLSDLANAATARTNLGLGSLATKSAVGAAEITDNTVGAAELNVSGNGTTSQYLRSDGDGTFTWATPPNTVYTHPSYNGDDFSVDTGALTGATVVSDIDINVTTDGLGHVTDANGSVSTRTLTLADLGYTGETNATADQTAAEILTAIKTVDGSGSGLDADLLDGQQGSYYYPASNPNGYTTNVGDITGVTAGSYLTGGGTSGGVTLNVDATTTATASKVVARDASGDDYRRYGFASYFNMSHSATTRNSDTVFYSSTDNYIRKNNAAGMRSSLGLGSLATLSTVNAATITDNSVGAAELNVSGNGTTSQFLRSDGDGTFTWATPTDTNTTYSAGTNLSLSGTTFNVSSTPSFTDVYVDDQILSTGDTNTYMQFHAADQWRVVTGGSERLEVNNSTTTVATDLVVSGGVASNGLEVYADTDNHGTIGRAKVGYCGHSDHASFAHYDQNTTTGYALLQSSNGTTYLNAASGAGILFRVANSTKAELYSNGVFGFEGNISGVGSGATVRIHLAGGTPSSSNTGIAAAWNVHSDYRLKENVSEITGAIDTVKALRPINFSWVEEEQDEATTGGFLAHELDEHIPYAVLGEKDAVNENGDIISQAADYSKVVPVLTAALQEAIAKIETLETRIAALEAE